MNRYTEEENIVGKYVDRERKARQYREISGSLGGVARFGNKTEHTR